ncbi:hypothetical protein D3C87_1905710 [compost metagenome]
MACLMSQAIVIDAPENLPKERHRSMQYCSVVYFGLAFDQLCQSSNPSPCVS